MNHIFHSTILREYDIRGIYGKTLFDADAYALGRVFAQTVKERTKNASPTIALGYDGRLSSPALVADLERGMLEEGVEILNIGCGPTPLVSFAHFHLETDASVMVTGSHNPADQNGFKMTLQKAPFYGADIQVLGEKARNIVPSTAQHGVKHTLDITADYVNRLVQDMDIQKPFTVVWDAGNGAAGAILEALLPHVPGRHILLNGKIDGTFPNHHPDPTVAENLVQLQDEVHRVGADCGLAFDGDGDRLGAIDSQGRILCGDQILILLARSVLKELPGAPIIADVKASTLLFDKITEFGGVPVMWRTGHSLIKSKMKELQAPLAGEMSGHIFFAHKYYGFDDALYAGLRLLESLSQSGGTLSEFYDSLPKLYNTPEIRLDCEKVDKQTIMHGLKAQLVKENIKFNDLDGVRVHTSEGWWGVRASNTQEALTLRVEASTPLGLSDLKTALQKRLTPFGMTF